MCISKKITTLKEPLDIDLQLMATELDTSAKDLKYLSDNLMEDPLTMDSFSRICKELQNEGSEVTNFNDNTVLYEYEDEAVVYHESLGTRYVIFDVSVSHKMELKMRNTN